MKESTKRAISTGKPFLLLVFTLICVSSCPVFAQEVMTSGHTEEAQNTECSSPTLLFPLITGVPWINSKEEQIDSAQNWISIPEGTDSVLEQELFAQELFEAEQKVQPAGVIELASGVIISEDAPQIFPLSQDSAESTCTDSGICSVIQENTSCVQEEKNEVDGTFFSLTKVTFGCEKSSCLGSNSRDLRFKRRDSSCIPVSGSDFYEYAPMEKLLPSGWRTPIGVDPWIDVFYFEKVCSASCFCELGMTPLSAGNEKEQSSILAKEKPIAEVKLDIRSPKGRMPEQRSRLISRESGPIEPLQCRQWGNCEVHWNACELAHTPLYFEEENLERHGYSRGYFQPAVSGAKFFSKAALLPGLMTIDSPFSLNYALGDSRPGSYRPYQVRRAPWNAQAILVQAGVVTGLSFIIP